jgi:hypothetical protein
MLGADRGEMATLTLVAGKSEGFFVTRFIV